MTSPTGTERTGGRVRGFTLVETLVVLTLIAIVTGALLPRIAAGLRGPSLEDVAHRIVLAMRETQAMALASGESAVLHVDVGGHRVRLPRGGSRQIDVPREWQLKLITARRELLGGGAGGIRFFPDGSSTGGRLHLADGSRELSVDVTWLTGRITVTGGKG